MITRAKNSHVISDIGNLSRIGALRKELQNFFWLEIFERIGETYTCYSESLAEATNVASDFKHVSMQVFHLDLEVLSKIPELKFEIKEKQSFVQEITSTLEIDYIHFQRRVNIALFRKQKRMPGNLNMSAHQTWTTIREAFTLCLEPWFDVRNKLTDELLKNAIEEMGSSTEQTRAEYLLKDLRRISRIRKGYAILEILMPLTVSIAALIFMHYRF